MPRRTAVLSQSNSLVPRWFALFAGCAVTLTAIATLALAAARLH